MLKENEGLDFESIHLTSRSESPTAPTSFDGYILVRIVSTLPVPADALVNGTRDQIHYLERKGKLELERQRETRYIRFKYESQM
jgi:hypothetical protein